MTDTTTTRPITPDDLFAMRFLNGAALSPDGGRVAYVISAHDAATEKDSAHIWLHDLTAGTARQLNHGADSNSNPRWSPDGSRLAFISSRSGAPQLYVMPVDGGEARQLTTLEQGVGGGPDWSPDGKTLVFTAGRPPKTLPEPGKPYRVTRRMWRFDGAGYLHAVTQDIYTVPVAGGEPTQLTADDAVNSNPQWSPDGNLILYQASLPGSQFRLYPGLRLVTTAGEQRDLVWVWGQASGAVWHPDGQRVIFVGQPAGQHIGTKNDLYVVAVDGAAPPENRTPSLAIGVGGGLQGDTPNVAAFTPALYVPPHGATAFAPVQDGGELHLYEVALSGDEAHRPVLAAPQRSQVLLAGSADQLLYVAADFHEPGRLCLADHQGEGEEVLVQLNEALLAEVARPVVDHFHVNGANDDPIEGWLMRPTTGEPPYPTVLYIHGGPWGAFGYVYSFDFQMLAGAGYAVLFTNYHGSSGYGSEFGTALQENWGRPDFEDHMASLDYWIDQGVVDGNRLGVAGISAGGYGSCSVITRTDRFKAAVPENPVTNLQTLYAISDIGPLMADFLGGAPHEAPQTYARCSPITNAHRCTTPTLLIQGEADFRCPPDQSEQFYNTLKANGCIVEMLRLPDSPHIGSIAGPAHVRRAQNDALLGWMNRYVLGLAAAEEEE